MRIGKHIYTKNNLVLYTNPKFKSPDHHNEHIKFHASVANKFDGFKDISYPQLSQLSGQAIPADTIYVCEMFGKSCYKYLEYLELSQSLESIQLVADVNFRISEWKVSISLLTFVDALQKQVQEQYSICSQQENLFDEDLVHIKFMFFAKPHDLHAVIQRFSKRLSIIHNDIFAKHAEDYFPLFGC